MLFKGRLRLPSDPGEGIPIDLVLEDVYLSLDSGGEDFGEWRLDTVEIKRLFSNQFSLLLDGEEMVFVADDALGFAYEGLSTVEDVQSRLSKRRIFKGRKSPKKKTVAAAVTEPETDEPAVQIEDAPAETRPDVPMPEVVPFFPEKSPSFAESVAESAVVDEGIAPVAPKPIEIAAAPVEPAVGEATPPALDAEPEPAAEEPAVPVATPAVDASAVDAQDEDDDELVIEDVSAYGYVPVKSASVGETRPVETHPATEDESADDEFEIEDAAPATGAVLRQVHPLGEPEPEPEAPAARGPEVHPLGESTESKPSEPPPARQREQEIAAAPVAPEPEPEQVAASAASDHEDEAVLAKDVPDPVPLPPDDAPSFAQWSSNGRVTPDPEPTASPPEPRRTEQAGTQTQKPGRHARSSTRSRSSIFGRKKSREPEEHEHRYESSKTVGGITRSVCGICGHVSFAGEDVYQNW